MSRKNFKKNLVALLACSALLLAALGCESVTGPDSTTDSSLSPSDGASFSEHQDNVGG
jgi:hypothetical protein